MSHPLLESKNLDFAYRHGPTLFENWSASFFAGEVTALTGQSGRGKSTLLYMLGLMLMPRCGEVWVKGIEQSKLSDRQRAETRANLYGFVFQDAALDTSRTVLDNVTETALYRHQDQAAVRGRARELLTEFGVSMRETHRPSEISGGQAQRIALCRALLNLPAILICDEPTGNLDAESAGVVVSALRSRADAGGTVIVATHDRDVMRQCDRIIEL